MGEKDAKQPVMPGFGVPEKPRDTLLQYKQRPLLSPEQTGSVEPSKTTPKSVSGLIDLIEVKHKSTKNINEQKPFKVKMMDREHWIDFDSERIGKATILFIFLSSKQYSGVGDAEYHIKEMEYLAEEIYSSKKEVDDNILEQVGVYLFTEYPHKAKDKDLDSREMQKAIDYCLDERNKLTIKAMVQENKGIKLPDHYHN